MLARNTWAKPTAHVQHQKCLTETKKDKMACTLMILVD